MKGELQNEIMFGCSLYLVVTTCGGMGEETDNPTSKWLNYTCLRSTGERDACMLTWPALACTTWAGHHCGDVQDNPGGQRTHARNT